MSEPKSLHNAADTSQKRLCHPNATRSVEDVLENLRTRIAEREARKQARSGPRLTTSMRPTERILLFLKKHGQNVFGLRVYRLTYEDDSAWQKFMNLLNSETRYSLTQVERALPEGEELLSMLDWDVQDSKEEWDGASLEQVRRHFQNSPRPSEADPRGAVCIVVDTESLQSIVDAKRPIPSNRRRQDSPFVKILDAMSRPQVFRSGQEQNLGESGEEMKGDVGNDELPKEIRYLKVEPSIVLPFFYDRLMIGFDEVYHTEPRPPYICAD
ncbi:putative twin arginine translocation protein [Lasiodiplodia theobromae]|nr:putative twin arginine translocation protein [Lasiodiplodia theobromae]